MTARTFRISTLGCRVNRSESISIERRLLSAGYSLATEETTPSLWIVNTCAVTAEGMRKSRKLVRKIARTGAEVIVIGCGSELDPEVFRVPGVSTVSGASRKKEAVVDSLDLTPEAVEPYVDDWHNRPGKLVRVPVKVQDGCRNFCSYCIIPHLRREWSCRPLSKVVEEITRLGKSEIGEVIICGINLGTYRDPETGAGLEGLLRAMIPAAGEMRIRLSSIEFNHVTDGLLQVMNENRGLMRHLHLPLQSGDARILKLMNRGYSPDQYSDRIREIRAAVPGVAITTDVMVGFPGEDEEAFQGTAMMLNTNGFSRTHVFRYSPRPLTAASGMRETVSSATKERRSSELRRIAERNACDFHSSFTGRIIEVLVEDSMESEPGKMFGRAESFAGVIFEGAVELVGEVVNVRAIGGDRTAIRAELVN